MFGYFNNLLTKLLCFIFIDGGPPHGSDPWSMPGSSAQPTSSYPGAMGAPQYSQAGPSYMSHPGREQHMVSPRMAVTLCFTILAFHLLII